MTTPEFLRRARRDGWQATPTRGGHVRLEHPDAAGPVITGSTPSDHRAMANAMAEMRRQLRAAQGENRAKPEEISPARKPAPRPKPEPRDRRPLVGRAIEQGSRRIKGTVHGITVELVLDETRGRSWTVFLSGAST